MKKELLLGMALVLTFTAAGSVTAYAADEFEGEGLNEAKEINIGYIASYPEWSVNNQKRILEEEFASDDVELNYLEFAYGVPAVEAVASGDVDFVISGDLPVFTSLANGVGIQSVYYGFMDPNELAVVAAPDSGISEAADLAGKNVGLPIGTDAHNYFAQLLASADLSFEDVNLINLKAPDLQAAIISEDIDAAVIWKPNATGIAAGTGGSILFESGELPNGESYVPFKLLSVRTEFADANPLLTAKFVKAIDEIDQWFIDNVDEGIQLIIEEQGNDEEYWSTLKDSVYHGSFTDEDWAAAQKTIDFLVENELIKNEIEVSDIFTDKYLEKAKLLGES